jgi:hypothetical protein
MDGVQSTRATGQQRERRRLGTSAERGDGEVAAGRRSGWRGARGRGQRGKILGRCSGGERRVEATAAGGGAGEELARR